MTPKIQRGFAVMAPDRQRAIASQGGKAAHAQGVAHEWTASEAAVAGQRGGRVTAAQRRARADQAAPGREDDTC
jgi:hypothetical protein